MKNKIIFAFFLVSILLNCGNSVKAQNNDVFGLGVSLLGVVTDNKIKFYNTMEGWEELTNLEFTPPNGYKNVFGLGVSLLGVVINNKIKFYNAMEGWEELANLEFLLK